MSVFNQRQNSLFEEIKIAQRVLFSVPLEATQR